MRGSSVQLIAWALVVLLGRGGNGASQAVVGLTWDELSVSPADAVQNFRGYERAEGR